MNKIQVMVMSGVEDGTMITLDPARGDGMRKQGTLLLTIGRKDENDIVLRHDTFVSRLHARVHVLPDQCWLEDCNSTNGTFIENPDDLFTDQQVTGKIEIKAGQIFRIGRTWLRIENES